jgi:uncharacterized membrane protein YGL010W
LSVRRQTPGLPVGTFAPIERMNAMRTLTEHLSTYAEYHRDRRNIATHFVGIPMIVVGLLALLARPTMTLGMFAVSPALLVYGLGSLFYFALDVRFGAAMAVIMGAAVGIAVEIAGLSQLGWAVGGIGLFVLGWVIQFIGHAFEGRKPAFVDDLVGFLVGPLFVVAELGFMLGQRRELLEAIEAKAGPTRSGPVQQPLPG